MNFNESDPTEQVNTAQAVWNIPNFQKPSDPYSNAQNAGEKILTSRFSSAAVLVVEPKAFSDMPTAVRALQNHHLLILKLINLSLEEAQRCIDFLSGAALIFDGRLEKIDASIFIFTPFNVSLSYGTSESPIQGQL